MQKKKEEEELMNAELEKIGLKANTEYENWSKFIYRLFNRITNTCFLNCIKNYNSKTLDENEITCVNNCVEKYMQAYNRCSVIIQDNASEIGK